MSRVAEKHQVAREPPPTVDPADGLDEEIIERRHFLQQVRSDGKDPSPLLD
jgi:hypothetical protein